MKDLQKKAIAVLQKNWRGGFSIPCPILYPFQWFWDSGFIAIGLAHFDMPRAKEEIETLLKSQWSNGFIPHIVFHTESDTYFPGPNFHRADLHPQSSAEFPSTGMTQPPVTGFVLEEMYNIASDKNDALEFVRSQIDKVYFNHEYFYNNRDINNEGLVYIYHNWESGTDNSPIWDDVWETMNPPDYKFERRDTSLVDESERPSKREYDHYIHIIEIAKKYNYSDKKIAEHSPFLVQDPLFNSMLIKSNDSLINLYTILGNNQDKIDQLTKWSEKGKSTLNSKLYNEKLQAYVHFDLVNNRQIEYVTSSSFTPIFAGVPSKERADKLVQTMLEKFGGENRYLCASFDPTSEKFEPKRYWRGPIWININWMLYKGFKGYGYTALSNQIKKDSLELVEKTGFHEYFDCRKNESDEERGCGGDNFSWSAALIIDFLN